MLFTCFVAKSWNKNIKYKWGRSRRQHSVSFQIYISMPFTNQEKNKDYFHLHLGTISGYIQYKGHCTKRNAQILCCKLQTWLSPPSCHIVQHWGFAFDRWKCIHELDPDTITHLFGHVKRILIGHSRGHVITFFFFNKNRHGLSSLEIPSQYI